jgi:hypothetical protein
MDRYHIETHHPTHTAVCHLYKGNISILIERVNTDTFSHIRAPNATVGHNTYTATG